MKIDVSLEVFKALTALRRTEEMTENDVIKELIMLSRNSLVENLLGDRPLHGVTQDARQGTWQREGVVFPEGTEFRASLKGKLYEAKVKEGQLWFNGRGFDSPSEAAKAITGYGINGWNFWECKRPGDTTWVWINKLRGQR